MTFTHVLVPTDFSEAAQHALHHALEEATLHHAKVTLLHVLPAHTGTDVYFITGFPGAEPQKAQRGFRENGAAELGRYDNQKRGHDIRHHMAPHHPQV